MKRYAVSPDERYFWESDEAVYEFDTLSEAKAFCYVHGISTLCIYEDVDLDDIWKEHDEQGN